MKTSASTAVAETVLATKTITEMFGASVTTTSATSITYAALATTSVVSVTGLYTEKKEAQLMK